MPKGAPLRGLDGWGGRMEGREGGHRWSMPCRGTGTSEFQPSSSPFLRPSTRATRTGDLATFAFGNVRCSGHSVVLSGYSVPPRRRLGSVIMAGDGRTGRRGADLLGGGRGSDQGAREGRACGYAARAGKRQHGLRSFCGNGLWLELSRLPAGHAADSPPMLSTCQSGHASDFLAERHELAGISAERGGFGTGVAVR